jgi:hypothetical protein
MATQNKVRHGSESNMAETRRKRKIVPRMKPLRRFDFNLIKNQLEGFLFNVDRDLQRRRDQAAARGDADAERVLALLNILVRFANNSYHAVSYLGADTPEDSNRKPNYMLAVPNVNRQLLDLLFSLVYILDDIRKRSLEYQRAGWRELLEEYRQYKTRFAKELEWQDYFQVFEQGLDEMVLRFGITRDEQKDPSLVPYWKHPFELKDKKTLSRPFLRYLDKWLYGDTSSQAHLSFGGLIKVAPFIVAPLVGGEDQKITENRTIQQYRYMQLTRTVTITLAISTEIDEYCSLGNEAAADYVWTILSEYNAEAKEMFELRYRDRKVALASRIRRP